MNIERLLTDFICFSPATVNKELTALRHLFNKGIEWGYLTNNPLSKVKRLKVIQRKFRFLTLNEIDLVLRNCPASIYPIILTAIHTGLRKSELFRLEWEDVDNLVLQCGLKAIVLVALADGCPNKREELLARAEKLNLFGSFPYRLLKLAVNSGA